jgi:hypothetical protein
MRRFFALFQVINRRMLRAGLLSLSIALWASPAGAASWLEQKLKEIDRSVCQSYQSVKCKAKARKAAAKPAAPKPRAKPAAEAPAETVIAKTPPPAADPEVPEIELIVPKTSGVPKPRPKPVPAAAIAEVEDAPLAIPKPRAKPAGLAKVAVVVPSDVAEPAPPPAAGNCPARLASLAVSFDLVTERVSNGGCGVSNPVRLRSQKVGGETVAFPDGPTLTCPFAVRFAEWMKEQGVPLTRRNAGSAVAEFHTGPGYQCRGRNGARSGKLSEHAFGNAIDIERFELANGKVVQVGEGDRRTVQALRTSACQYFTTVLGPGANAAHEKHLHFDLARRGRTGTYRICE